MTQTYRAKLFQLKSLVVLHLLNFTLESTCLSIYLFICSESEIKAECLANEKFPISIPLRCR